MLLSILPRHTRLFPIVHEAFFRLLNMSNYILWLRDLGREVKLLKEEAITIVATSWLSRIKLTGHHWCTLLIVITKGLTPPVFGLFVKNIPANYTSIFTTGVIR